MVNSRGARPLRLVAYTDAVDYGGAEACLGNLLSVLDPGYQVTVMGVDAGIVGRVTARRPECGAVVVRPVRDKRDIRGITDHVRVVRRLRPDVFQANLRTTWTCQYGILAALLAPGVPVIAVEHSPLPTSDWRHRALKRIASRRLAAHVAVGRRAARLVEEFVGLEPGDVIPIHNGVPELQLRPVERPVAGPLVGSLGRLYPEKGYDVLVRALPRLPDVTVLLVGDGPERSTLEALARSLGVADRLLITGWLDDARRYLSCLDVFVLPSRREGLPLAIIEAMFARRPVVATDVGSVSEAVAAGESGLLCPPDDVDALVSAIGGLLRDPELRARFGEAGRARALRGFSLTAMGESYEALYERICG